MDLILVFYLVPQAHHTAEYGPKTKKYSVRKGGVYEQRNRALP